MTNYNRKPCHNPRILPILALNDVFIGESVSARVSFYEMRVDDGPSQKQKGSGVTICTGTGSTSWHFNINHISEHSVQQILELGRELSGQEFSCDASLSKEVRRQFNNSLVYDPADYKMAFSVRDPIPHGIFKW